MATSSGGGESALSSEARPDTDYRVTLRNSLNRGERVTFVTTPELVETQSVNYKMVDPIHAPGGIYAFATSASRTFTLSSIKLISRTPEEAAANLMRLWILRGWTKPDFGGLTGNDTTSAASSSSSSYDLSTLESAGLGGSSLGGTVSSAIGSIGTVSSAIGSITGAVSGAVNAVSNTVNAVSGAVSSATGAISQLGNSLGVSFGGSSSNGTSANTVSGGTGSTRGAPPAVLLLSAYSRDSVAGSTPGGRNTLGEHINQVPVVIQNMSIPYPADVDYIPAEGSGVPMPTIMMIDLSLVETHSPREYEQFDLSAYKNGILAGF